MELSINKNRLRAHSLDDEDNLSGNSRNSYGYYNSYNSAFNSDSEYSGPVSVRDMIKLYNNQLQKDESNTANQKIKHKTAVQKQSQHLLAATKSSYCGLNKYSSQADVKQFVDQLDDKSSTKDQYQIQKKYCCKKCTNCECWQKRSHTIPNIVSVSSSLLQYNNENNNCNQSNAKDILVAKNMNPNNNNTAATTNNTLRNKPTNNGVSAELKDDLNKKHSSQVLVEKNLHHHNHHLLSTDSVEEANGCQPIETSYQSKTTIAKTSSGVRIIIDIFFDQEQSVNATDVVGSRVETDIPQSRILTEFQQQAMAASVVDAVSAISSSASANKDQQS